MATGEDEPKLIVLDSLVVRRLGIRGGLAIVTGSGGQHDTVATAPSKGVDGLESADGHEPGAGIARHTIARPLLQGGPECLLDGLLGRVEVAEKAYQRGQDYSRLVAIDLGYLFAQSPRRIHPSYLAQ